MTAKNCNSFFVTAFASFACFQAHAVTVVNITNADRGSFGTSAGTAGTVSAGALGATTQLVTYQITGLDLAEDSSADDTITFVVGIASTGSSMGNVAGDIDASGLQWGVAGVTDAEVDLNEGLTFSLDSFSFTLGTAPGMATVSFDGFSGLSSWYTGGGDTATITGATVAAGTNGNTPRGGNRLHGNQGNVTSNFDSLVSSFEVESTSGGNGFYLGNLDLQFTAEPVPEPSVALLGGLGLLGLLRRRRA